MAYRWRRFAFLVLPWALLAACSQPSATPAAVSEPAEAAVVRGKVQDMTAFGRFIETRPTPPQFRSRYPDVHLVMPGDITTKEFRTDNSRYFAELDAAGERIVGGKFM